MKHIASTLLLLTAPAWAHEGHGMPGDSHWHATDTWGLLLALALVAGALWWTRRK